jgi:hypothetical protein
MRSEIEYTQLKGRNEAHVASEKSLEERLKFETLQGFFQ